MLAYALVFSVGVIVGIVATICSLIDFELRDRRRCRNGSEIHDLLYSLRDRNGKGSR